MQPSFVEHLKQNYPSIQEIRIEAVVSSPSEAAPSIPPSAASASTPDHQTATANADTSETSEKSAALHSSPSEPQITDGAENQTSLASGVWVIVVRKYHLKTINKMLTEVAEWAKAQNKQIQPVVLTSREAELLQRYSITDTLLDPAQIIASYKQKEGFPATARRHILAALEEIQRMLRNLEQDFPTSGYHAHNNGMQIQAIWASLTRWGAALYNQPYTDPQDMWSFLCKQFSTHRYLSRAEVQSFPLHLSSFLLRHQALSVLLTQTYGNNDLEIEHLTEPLLAMARQLRSEAQHRLTLKEERQQRNRRRFLVTSTSLGSLAIIAAIVWWILRPPMLSAVALPKGSQPGGIVGNYHGGQNFNRWLNRRVDTGINMYWPSRPIDKVPDDYYSVRWKGFLEAPATGKYRICAEYDDGAQLRIGNKDVVSDWNVGGARSKCKVLFLERGWHPLYLQMFEARGMSLIKLSWEHRQRSGLHPIPAQHFCCKQ